MSEKHNIDVTDILKKADELLKTEQGQKVMGSLSKAATAENVEKLKGSAVGKAILGDDGKLDEGDVMRLSSDLKKVTDTVNKALKK